VLRSLRARLILTILVTEGCNPDLPAKVAWYG
jgi:hypothetical protein